ncbi:MAG: integrase family protein [Herbinix sp.]|jgi:integrase|nr:integrase family protein [Herbinix sp.]
MKKENEKKIKRIRPHVRGGYIGRYTYLGKTHSVYGKTERETERKLNDLIYELNHGIMAKNVDNITVDTWHEHWIKEYKETKNKPGTVVIYKGHYRLYIKEDIGRMKLKAVRPEHIKQIYNKLSRNGYSTNTIELVSIILSGMFKEAVNNEKIPKNPVSKVEIPRAEETKEIRVLTVEEQENFMKYAKNSKCYELIFTALTSGMRSGELRGLLWSEVDLDNCWISVKKTLNYRDHTYVRDNPKTKDSVRDIPIMEPLYKVLKEYKEKQDEQRLLLGSEWKARAGLENLVFPSDNGSPMNRDVLKVAINKIVESMNKEGILMEHVTPHCFRHTFATRSIEDGMDMNDLKVLLGHSTLSQTMDLYVHVLPTTKKRAIKKVEMRYHKHVQCESEDIPESDSNV